MRTKDYYAILGVARDAPEEDIKRAFRKLARLYHPDVSDASDAEERFKEINEAYDVLKDAEKREAYDRFGADWANAHQYKESPDFSNAGFNADFANFDTFSDLFESLFGRGRTYESPHAGGFRMRGSDQLASVTISLEEAFHGCERTLSLGDANDSRRVKVKIPRGVVAGQRIRLAGQGMAGYGGEPNGDLFLEVGLLPHRLFRTEQRDVYLDVPLTPWEAALGGKVRVPTLGGNVELNIKAGTQTGPKMRLAGRGLPGDPPGDQIVEISIRLPAVDSDEKRALFEQMRDSMSFNPRETWPA